MLPEVAARRVRGFVRVARWIIFHSQYGICLIGTEGLTSSLVA